MSETEERPLVELPDPTELTVKMPSDGMVKGIQNSFLAELDAKLRVDPFFALPEGMHKMLMGVLSRLFKEKNEGDHVIKKRILAKLADTTFISYIKLPTEAYVGRKMTGDMKLDDIERTCYLISGISAVAAWAMGAEGLGEIDYSELATALLTLDLKGAKEIVSDELAVPLATYGVSWASYVIGIKRELADTLKRAKEQFPDADELHRMLESFLNFLNHLSLSLQP